MSRIQIALMLLVMVLASLAVSHELARLNRQKAETTQRMGAICAEMGGSLVQIAPNAFACRKGK